MDDAGLYDEGIKGGRMNRVQAMSIVLLLAAAAAVGQSSHAPNADASSANRESTFAQLREQWARNLHEKRVEDSVAEYTTDAEFIEPDASRVRGTAALHQLFDGITKFYDSDLTFYSWHVEVSGDLAYDSGTYRESLVLRSTGEHQHSSGSYLTTYRRDKDGHWLITEQLWTGAVTADGAAAPGLDPHPVIALTFDDLPAAGSLPPEQNRAKIATTLTAELKANHLEGTYGFVNAVKLGNDPDAQQALHIWVDASMNVGSHTWSHISLSDNSAAAFEKEIAQNEPALAQYAGAHDWHWFRYPFLWEGDTLDKRREVRAYLRDHGYRVAQVSLDFEDYAWNDAYGRCVAKKDDASISWLKQSYLETAT
jgi:ketosteroid isomerase-like protein/peptidoglycan/xylan/chitin deacetylase (PgdA/CDA1 family)